MFSVSLILDTRSTKKDNTHPIKLRIILNRKTYHISLGYSVEEKDWNDRSSQIKKSCGQFTNVNVINHYLRKKKQLATEVLLKLEGQHQLDLPFKQIRQRITKGHSETFVLSYAQTTIDYFLDSGRSGNAGVYKTLQNGMKKFLNDKDIPLSKISYSWLLEYEKWYLAKGNSVNGLSVHMRTLRALINRAIRENLLSSESYAFKNYIIKQKETRKRAMTLEEIVRFKNYLPTTKRQLRAKDYFFVSFFMMGASFVDLAHLRVKQIQSDYIRYRRKKTGRLHNIPYTEQLSALLAPLISDKSSDDFVFNIIRSKDPHIQVKNIREELHRYNKTLKEIKYACDIKTPLTSYVARHTYATLAKRKGVPIAVISEALGHKTEGITQVYLDSFSSETMLKHHSTIIEGL